MTIDIRDELARRVQDLYAAAGRIESTSCAIGHLEEMNQYVSDSDFAHRDDAAVDLVGTVLMLMEELLPTLGLLKPLLYPGGRVPLVVSATVDDENHTIETTADLTTHGLRDAVHQVDPGLDLGDPDEPGSTWEYIRENLRRGGEYDAGDPYRLMGGDDSAAVAAGLRINVKRL